MFSGIYNISVYNIIKLTTSLIYSSCNCGSDRIVVEFTTIHATSMRQVDNYLWISSSNTTNRLNIAAILMKVALNTITLTILYIKWDSIDQYVQINIITIRSINNVLEECMVESTIFWN